MPRLVAASALVLLALLGPVGPAVADPPLDIDGPVTDTADVLGADEPRVREALDAFYDETGRQLFVVFVADFDGLTGAEWAEQTAAESGLGPADALLAVAVAGRSYGYSVDAEEYSESDLETVDRDFLLPALRQDDWAGTAVATAEGLADVGSGPDVPWGWVLGGVAVVGAGGVVAVSRQRRRYDHTHRVVDEHGDPVDPARILTDAELEAAAARALVEADDALQTSTQEVGYAEAQFGAEATAEFRRVLEEGRGHLREAFGIQQRLDDSEPETDEQRRALLSQVLALCGRVDAALDDQAEHFDGVRDLQHRAPEALEALVAHVAATQQRLPGAEATWRTLSSDHAAPVLAAVRENVDRATTLLVAATAEAGEARRDLDGSDTTSAALHLRTAEEATAQAVSLLDALETTAAELSASREAADDLQGRVTSTVAAVGTYLETHRGAVGSTARTRHSESARLLEEGRNLIATDPDAAQVALERADRLVQEAQSAAESDVAAWRADRDRAGRPDADLTLGGILLDGLAGGSRGRSTYRGSSRSRGPGSFGGSRTRSRRSTPRRSTSRRSSGRRSGGGRF